jgi:hypothetical protein
MNRLSMIIALFTFVATAFAAPDQKLVVSRFGGYPLSGNIITLWLTGPNRRPLLMVYFCGTNDWHNTLWNINSKFEGKQGWAELRSEKATLQLRIDMENGEAGVQSGKFKLTKSNVFLVLHTDELLVFQKIIPLGVFDLPASNDLPASVILLREHQELSTRINAEIRAGSPGTGVGDKAGHQQMWPCTHESGDVLDEKDSLLGASLQVSAKLTSARLFSSTYTVPCCRSRSNCR